MRDAVLAGALAMLAYLVAISGRAQEQKPGKDLAALQGKWRVWFDDTSYLIFEVKDESFSMTRHSAAGRPGATMKGTFVLDETTEPKQMTWKDVQGPGTKIDINRCIYELHGDTWLLIGAGKERPKHFLSHGNPHTTLILKREKAK